MKRTITIIAFITTALCACKKRESLIGDKYVTLSHMQTYCHDLWVTSLSSDSTTLAKCARYIDSVGLYRAGLSIKQVNPPEVCSSCFCKTGKIIYVTTFDGLQSQFSALGFQ